MYPVLKYQEVRPAIYQKKISKQNWRWRRWWQRLELPLPSVTLWLKWLEITEQIVMTLRSGKKISRRITSDLRRKISKTNWRRAFYAFRRIARISLNINPNVTLLVFVYGWEEQCEYLVFRYRMAEQTHIPIVSVVKTMIKQKLRAFSRSVLYRLSRTTLYEMEYGCVIRRAILQLLA